MSGSCPAWRAARPIVTVAAQQPRFLPRLRDFRELPRTVLAPAPLFLLQPVLGRMVRQSLVSHPELWSRLGEAAGKRILIDPLNLPFVLLLRLDPAQPELRAYRRGRHPPHDSRIAASLLTLLDLVDGGTDSDALFFSRELRIEGDTAAVVAMRNALEETEGRLADSVAAGFGPLAAPATGALTLLRAIRRRSR